MDLTQLERVVIDTSFHASGLVRLLLMIGSLALAALFAGCNQGYEKGELDVGTHPEVGQCTDFDPGAEGSGEGDVLLYKCDAPNARSRLVKKVDNIEDCPAGGVTFEELTEDVTFCLEALPKGR